MHGGPQVETRMSRPPYLPVETECMGGRRLSFQAHRANAHMPGRLGGGERLRPARTGSGEKSCSPNATKQPCPTLPRLAPGLAVANVLCGRLAAPKEEEALPGEVSAERRWGGRRVAGGQRGGISGWAKAEEGSSWPGRGWGQQSLERLFALESPTLKQLKKPIECCALGKGQRGLHSLRGWRWFPCAG